MRVRPLVAFALPLALAHALVTATARADPPDPSAAFFAGAATSVAGILAGSTVMATGQRGEAANNAGWLTMCGGFTLTPLVAHAVEGEWARGLAFAAIPGAMTAGTGALFAAVPGTVDSGTLWEQRLMWSLYGIAFLSAAAGVVDATLAPGRARSREIVVAPVAGAGTVGVQIGGPL